MRKNYDFSKMKKVKNPHFKRLAKGLKESIEFSQGKKKLRVREVSVSPDGKTKEVVVEDGNIEFVKYLQKIAKRMEKHPPKPRKNEMWYNIDGDILEFIHNIPEDYCSYAEWADPYLTVMRNQETDKIVGFQIWDFKRFLKKALQAVTKAERAKKRRK
jgi:hypothetical protein